MLRDRLVCGISDDRIQRRLLAERELTFEKAVEIATATEMASKNLIDIGGKTPSSDTNVNKVEEEINLHIFSENKSAIAAVETTIPRAVNSRTKCVTNVKRKATWLKYVEERRNLQSKAGVVLGTDCTTDATQPSGPPKPVPERASPNQVGTFSSTKGVSDWGNIGRLVKLHTSQSSPHHNAVIKGDNYLSIESGKQKDICSHLSSQVTATIERNHHILKAILDVIVLCGQQNIAIREHVERTSNFHSLLQFRAKTDPVLALHLQYDDNRAKYTSPRIQNELIELCGDYIRKSLVKDCNRAQFYAFLADEATDASTMEQISICVRFVHRKDEDNTVEVREEFLGFVEAESTKGVALAEKFMTTQAEFGIETRKMRAQGYDGAANMAGVHRGVQAIIKQHVPEAVYVHCKAHSLNLAIGHACKETLVCNMLSTLQTIAFAFDYSAERLLAFQESLRQDVLVREEMERRANLRTLCETRWASRADSLYTFRTAYPVVVQSLETLSDDGDGKARGYLCSIKQFDFIIALCATEHVLSNTVSLSKMLQGKNVDLI
ncbi:zinc finger MYM-type protein 1-like [Montipora capricornis]|uniref:zinc finger MYM-type protein 1-like n=1 Tax=Montipora capricornis TaxID=246305 RepID=UPI0035F1CEBE